MANGDGGAVINATWRLVVPVGALSLLAALTLLVQKDAAIALDVARQHGNELLLANSRITVLEAEARKGERYTSNDAAKDLRYIQKDIDLCAKELEEHKRIQH